MGSHAFRRLSSLERVYLPSTLNAIPAWAFSRCTLLRKVIFTDGIQSIGTTAFDECKSLENIVLPSTLNVIGDQAFFTCRSLRVVELHGGIQIMRCQVFHACDLLDQVRVPCTALVVTWNKQSQSFALARDEFTPRITHRNLVIASECFNSICPGDISDMKIAVMRVFGEEIMQWDESSYEYIYPEWDDKCQWIRALLDPHEKRHKNEIASLLELRLWKAETEQLDDDSDFRTRAECRPARRVEMVQDNVLSFLHFL